MLNAMEELPSLPEPLRLQLEKIRSYIIKFSLERPFAAFFIILLVCAMILPLITVSVLMPVVFILHFSTYITNNGIFYVIYIILFQGVVLILIMVSLFFVAFALATSLSVLHSYKFDQRILNQ